MESCNKAIKSRMKKKGEAIVETDYKGVKNFPRLCTKLMIEHPYLYDVLKKCQIEGETNSKEFLKQNAEN